MKCARFDRTETYEKGPYNSNATVVRSCNYYFNQWSDANPQANIQFIHTGFNSNGEPVCIMVYYLEAE